MLAPRKTIVNGFLDNFRAIFDIFSLSKTAQFYYNISNFNLAFAMTFEQKRNVNQLTNNQKTINLLVYIKA